MAKDPFLAAVEELEKMPTGYSARWTPERRYVEENVTRINALRAQHKFITFEAFCKSIHKNGGPKLDPVKLQNALYRVNMERHPDLLERSYDAPAKKAKTKTKAVLKKKKTAQRRTA